MRITMHTAMRTALPFLFLFHFLFHAGSVAFSQEYEWEPLPAFSKPSVHLELGGLPEDATAVFYILKETAEGLPVWEPADESERVSPSAVTVSGEHQQTLRFRPGVLHEKYATLSPITDFERTGSFLTIGFESSLQVFQCKYTITKENVPQGERCLLLQVTRHDDAPVQEDDVFGFLFTDRIPTRDWSRFKYLEFFYAGDLPQDPTLMVQGKGELRQAPLSRYYLDTGKQNQWRAVQIDLDTLFATPEERSELKAFALTHPVQPTRFNHTYHVRLDAFRLWSEDNAKDNGYETTIDGTPPSEPLIQAGKIEQGQYRWNWQPSVDPESGIKGYAYSWSHSSRDNPPDRIMTTDPNAAFSFVIPPNLTTFHFKVKACNHAGVWSEAVLKSITFNPKEYSSSR